MREKAIKATEVEPGKTIVFVKDYHVDECIKKKEVFHVDHDGKTMTLDPDTLVSREWFRTKKFVSQHEGGRDYCLVALTWSPNINPHD